MNKEMEPEEETDEMLNRENVINTDPDLTAKNRRKIISHLKNVTNLGPKKFYSTPEQLCKEMVEYFEETPKAEWRITDLAVSLMFTSVQSLEDYIKREDEFSELMRLGKTLVASKYEMGLEGKHVAGAIFALKHLLGWSDHVDIDQTNHDSQTQEQKDAEMQKFLNMLDKKKDK